MSTFPLKQGALCCAIRNLSYVLDIDLLGSVYFTSVQAILEYGLIVWGSSRNATCIFWSKNRIVRVMVGTSTRISCRNILKKLNILTLQCPHTHNHINKFYMFHTVHCHIVVKLNQQNAHIYCILFPFMHPYFGFRWPSSGCSLLQSTSMLSCAKSNI